MIQTYSFSEAGGHPANEDAYVLLPLISDPESWLICLADGQGGRAGGRRAAQLACKSVANSFPSQLSTLKHVDSAIAADPEAGFTTLVVAFIHGDQVTGASCGDSAVLTICGSGRITELTAEQFKNPPVGSGGAIFAPFEVSLKRPWRLLAMSDGVWKYVGWARVRDLAARLGGEALLAELQTAARLPRSGQFQDDFTAVLIEAT